MTQSWPHRRRLLGVREVGQVVGGLGRSGANGPDKSIILDPTRHVVAVDTVRWLQKGRGGSETRFVCTHKHTIFQTCFTYTV